MAGLLTIGEVAKRSGIRDSAIRYYERAGVLPKPIRIGGQRRYTESILARLAVLRRAKDCGLSLEEAKGLFEDTGNPSDRWQRIAKRKIVELDAMIERIEGMRDLLRRRCDCADLDECGRRIISRQMK